MRASSRPTFTRSLALAVAGALTLGVLTSCSSAVGEAHKGGSESGPSDGGLLRIGSTSDIVPATIFTNSSDATNTLIGAVYDSLVDYPLDSLEPQPRLATSWEQADDGLSLTLQLRDDVTFHSGRDFTSKDVEFSIQVDLFSGRYSVTANELLDIKVRAAKLFAGIEGKDLAIGAGQPGNSLRLKH